MGTKLLQVRYSVLTAITNVLDISLRETIAAPVIVQI